MKNKREDKIEFEPFPGKRKKQKHLKKIILFIVITIILVALYVSSSIFNKIVLYGSVSADYKKVNDFKSNYAYVSKENREDILKKIKEYSLRLFKSLDCSGLSRIDFFYDEENNALYLNEANTMPGFTTISMYPKLIESKGIEYKDLISILIDNSL